MGNVVRSKFYQINGMKMTVSCAVEKKEQALPPPLKLLVWYAAG